ncbi:hypothetical protein DL766_002617 [Monosporascus sp. MC13-8B]|uniref:Rhodanese domain-containing protein n=1 Tax=Monosporascus cannonballus TaxID=155416 RepID=A0ABY0H765_9PEZI|nr:hypothetical protein DL763_007883 [Monosporascus cannonballus]RYO83435.1 hypothetical protein DL762_006122 [Monosporascus cannonballus]RYP35274.1 hypothetical protein DL766_002617 [Monosporascus sp. MC13-8B]
MLSSRIGHAVLATAVFTSAVSAQESGWQANQVNATMCAWRALRAATLKDVVYMDGGYLYWRPGMADGSYGAATQDGSISKAPNGNAANNLAPNYYDGAMLANDHEFFLYGGLLRRTDAFSPPDANEVLAYQVSQYGIQKDGFKPGFVKKELPEGMTRYVTYGGAVSAPSEDKAWYFGGMRADEWGPIFYPSSNTSLNPTNISNTLITLDMSTQLQEEWTNDTLPQEIRGRADPEVVWVPVGEQGILVVLGGVSYPDFATPSGSSENPGQSERESDAFMATIDIYDIANERWYQQPTVAGPTQLTQGCAVVAVAQDYSSYNIYYYGGYDGINSQGDFNDDVWILSLPSFMWMKVASGEPAHGRAGHKCVKPYPDQMVVIGGATAGKANSLDCVQDNIMLNFNLTDGQWLDTYDPDTWSNYGVPQMIHLMIGGDYNGGATMTTPTPTGWADQELASVFATPYETSKLTNYYPYARESDDPTRENSGSDGGTPSWVAPVVGVIVGLTVVMALIVGILLYRRRKILRGGVTNPSDTDEQGNRVLSWIRGTSEKAPTVTTEDTPTPHHFDDMESRSHGTPLRQPEMAMHRQYEMPSEMPDTPLVELMDTSPRVELGDTALTPADIINKHTAFGSNPHTSRSNTNPSFYTGGAGSASQDHASVMSGRSAHHQVGRRPSFDHYQPQPQQQQQQRPDSPSLGGGGLAIGDRGNGIGSPTAGGTTPTLPPPAAAVAYGHQAQQHLRQVSEDTAGSRAGTPGIVSQPGSPNFAVAVPTNGSPLISPPSPPAHDAPDYVSARSGHQGRSATPQAGANRRSMFHENPDDLGERR